MCQRPTHQVNVSRKWVLFAPDSSTFFRRHPVLSIYETYQQVLEAAWVTMGKKLIACIRLSPVVHKENIDGHIFTMQLRSF